MKNTQNAERMIDTFVKRCIDNIIKHKLIEKVTDLKSFAKLVLDDDSLVEYIEQGYEITYMELSDEEREKVEYLAFRSLYDKEYPRGSVTIRPYGKGKLYEQFLTIVCNRISQLLKKINTDIQREINPQK
jgi:hypothetical protein